MSIRASMLTFAVAVITVMLAQAASIVSDSDKRVLDETISTALERQRSGTQQRWYGPDGAHGTVTPQLAYSRSTGSVCDSCNDPCRRVSYTIVTQRGEAEYRGARCRVAPEDPGEAATWSLETRDELVRFKPAVIANPVPKPAAPSSQLAPRQPVQVENKQLVADIQAELTALKYYDGAIDGKFNDSTRSALSEFLSDENSGSSSSPSEMVLQQLRLAKARIIHAPCAGAGEKPAAACGTIAD